MRQMEAGAEKPKPKSVFQRGDKVRVIDGPFVNFQGVVEDMNPERGRMKVVVPVFGRPDPRRARVLPGGASSDMAKKVQAMVKLQIPAGKANPSPPVGPALGQHGVNIMEFCKGFNAQTARRKG